MPCPEVRTSAEWTRSFAANISSMSHIPWDLGAELTDQDADWIIHSLRAWQLGETSDGSHLRAAASRYADANDDPDFVDCIELFIKEEQRHGHTLGLYLDLARIPRIVENWGDSIFRAIRYFLPSMELFATVVIMVETIALIYYNAVRRATSSTVLRTICTQILRDEVIHIPFQYERLAILHRRRPRWLHSLTMLLHRLLFVGVTAAVWFGHSKALVVGGYSFRSYWRAAWSKMRNNWRKMDPRRYHWPVAEAKPKEHRRVTPEELRRAWLRSGRRRVIDGPYCKMP